MGFFGAQENQSGFFGAEENQFYDYEQATNFTNKRKVARRLCFPEPTDAEREGGGANSGTIGEISDTNPGPWRASL